MTDQSELIIIILHLFSNMKQYALFKMRNNKL